MLKVEVRGRQVVVDLDGTGEELTRDMCAVLGGINAMMERDSPRTAAMFREAIRNAVRKGGTAWQLMKPKGGGG